MTRNWFFFIERLCKFNHPTHPPFIAIMYGPLPTTLHRFSPSLPLVAALTAPASPCCIPSYLVLLGGLSDGLLPTPYTVPLATAASEMGWNFVNPSLRTAGLQFGFGSLDTDAEDLGDLVKFLRGRHEGRCRIVTVGHSTGCQATVHFSRVMGGLDGLILQAPVSDRQTSEDNTEWQNMARQMKTEGKGSEFMPRAAHWAPITADRFYDLYVAVGEGDDYFSTDLPDDVLRKRLGHLGKLDFAVFVYSEKDEYVPEGVDIKSFSERVAGIVSGTEHQFLEGANHNLGDGEGAVDKFVGIIVEKLEGMK